jgi:hypothetical protein
VTAPGYVRPEPLTSAAQRRPRDPSGRVLAPIKVEVQFTRRGGYRRYVSDWAEAAAFLAGPDFAQSAAAVKSVTITATDPDPGPEAANAHIDNLRRRHWAEAG